MAHAQEQAAVGEARYRGALIETTVTEIRLLEAFASRPGIVLSRARLLALARRRDLGVRDGALVRDALSYHADRDGASYESRRQLQSP